MFATLADVEAPMTEKEAFHAGVKKVAQAEIERREAAESQVFDSS